MNRTARAFTLSAAAALVLLAAVRPSFAVNPPSITNFTPSGGLPGTKVTITGLHFTSTSAVTFNGAPASFQVDSRTQISATVPANASTGRIRVVTSYGTGASATKFVVSPIAHVVVLYMENHSFDNVFGKMCVKDQRCNGTTTGLLPHGVQIPLAVAKDIVPQVQHNVKGFDIAIHGGRMNGWPRLKGCAETDNNYQCYSQFGPSQIPNLTALARAFAISDNTFESFHAASWASHMDLAASTVDNFYGDDPKPDPLHEPQPGGGCDSFKQMLWTDPVTQDQLEVPSCVPDTFGNGPWRASPVQYVPTIMGNMDQADLSWHLDAALGPADNTPGTGYEWAICPTFWECFDPVNSIQRKNWYAADQVLTDVANGTLPNLSLVVPTAQNSQHNFDSMRMGDNWIGDVVGAIENSVYWQSTAIFITYDDCGCFYDHVPPPNDQFGIRVPMVMVSPYAKAGFTDSKVASVASILAFVEHTFNLTPLTDPGDGGDADAYDFANSFDTTQAPLATVAQHRHRIPAWELNWLRHHPQPEDVT
jgi:phospholipase C